MSTTSRPGSPSPASTSRSAAMSGGRRTSGGGPPSPPRPRAPTPRGASATSACRRRRLAPRAARDAPPAPATRRAAHPAMARTGATPRRLLAGSLARSLACVRPSRPQPPNHPLLVSHPLDGARTAPLAPAAPPAPARRRAPRPRPRPAGRVVCGGRADVARGRTARRPKGGGEAKGRGAILGLEIGFKYDLLRHFGQIPLGVRPTTPKHVRQRNELVHGDAQASSTSSPESGPHGVLRRQGRLLSCGSIRSRPQVLPSGNSGEAVTSSSASAN